MTTTPIVSPPLRAVLFDMDGTLIDSTENGNRAWTKWADEAGIVDRSFQETYHGRPGRQVLAEIVPEGQIESAFQRIVEIEETDLEGIEQVAGAEALLASLTDTQRAIVTSSLPTVLRLRLAAAGLAAPATVVTADQTSRGKPHPDPFLRGAALLGVAPADVAVFEDTPPGIEAARAAGAAFVVAVEGTHPREHLHADAIVPDLTHVALEAADDGVFRLVIDVAREPVRMS